FDVAADRFGRRVFVTGVATDPAGHSDLALTIAYAARTGRRLWLRRFAGAGSFNIGSAVAVDPDGGRVYVAATLSGRRRFAIGFIAYDAANGRMEWVRRYWGPRSQFVSGAQDIAFGWHRILIGGDIGYNGRNPSDYATLAYD